MNDKCICCKGKGRIKKMALSFINMNPVTIPTYRMCRDCNGFGYVDQGAPEGYVNDMETGGLRKL